MADTANGPVAHFCAGEYSLHPWATRAGRYVFTTGVPGEGQDAESQIASAFATLESALTEAGASYGSVGLVVVWLADMADRAVLDRHWLALFPDPHDRPARMVVRANFPERKLVEIEAFAVTGAKRTTINAAPNVAAWEHAGPVPLAAEIGGVLFSSAITGAGAGGVLPDDPGTQIDGMFQNARHLLAHCGYSAEDAAHLFVWQRDHALRQRVNDPWAELFPDKFRRPARHALMIDSGPVAAQINFVAVKSEDRETLTELGGLSHTGQREPGFLPLSSRRGELLFTAATFGADKTTGGFIQDTEEQIRSALEHSKEIVEAQGCRIDQVAHAYIWYKNDDYRAIFDPLWQELFPDPSVRPVRHDIKSPLPDVLQLQIELIAVRG